MLHIKTLASKGPRGEPIATLRADRRCRDGYRKSRNASVNKSTQIQTKTYVKPTNTGLLLHYKSHVDDRYKRGLLKTMLDRAFRLSSNWSYFSEECDRLKIVFSRLDYPDKLVNSTITRFIADKASDQPTSRLPTATNMQDHVRLVLPFKDQASADIVRTQLNDQS